MYGSFERASYEVDHIMKKLDMNNNGTLDYSGKCIDFNLLEFLLATISVSELLTTDKLRAAFDVFDTDGSGEITMDEIRSALGAGN